MDLGLAGARVLVTGGASNIGRGIVHGFAREGSRIVLSDVDKVQAERVRDEALALGAQAVELVVGDLTEDGAAEVAVGRAATAWGGLDALVNNAGINRDRMLVSMSEQEWDAVLRVDLKGHFAPLRHAAAYWRERAKAGEPVAARIVNTSSGAGLMGSVGQGNYGAAKAGIAALTVASARSLARYGVTANAICPRARTAMTAGVFGAAPADEPDPLSPEHVAPFVAYLASPAAARISGQVFVVYGGMVAVMGAPSVAARFDAESGTWTADELDRALGGFFAYRDPDETFASTAVLRLT
jgi:3-oxoacyl-[acyl-carrier protein] reductase